MPFSKFLFNQGFKPNVVQSNFICMVAIVFFAFGFPALDVLLDDWGIISIAATRNVLAFIFIFLVWVFWEGFGVIFKANWFRGFWIGSFGFGIGSLLLVITQSLTSPVVAALAAALMPLAGLFLDVIFDKRQITALFIIGVILVLLGGIISLGFAVLNVKFGLGIFAGLCSVSTFAWGSRATVKNLPGMTVLGQTAITTFGMASFCTIAYIISLGFDTPATRIPIITFEGIIFMLIYSLVGLGISQILWIKAVKNLGIGIASFHLNLTPFYVMVIMFSLGSGWQWNQTLGALIILLGVVFSQYKKA